MLGVCRCWGWGRKEKEYNQIGRLICRRKAFPESYSAKDLPKNEISWSFIEIRLSRDWAGGKKKKWTLYPPLQSFLAWRTYTTIMKYYNSFINFWHWFSEKFVLCCLLHRWLLGLWTLGIYIHQLSINIHKPDPFEETKLRFCSITAPQNKNSLVFTRPRNKLVEYHRLCSYRKKNCESQG